MLKYIAGTGLRGLLTHQKVATVSLLLVLLLQLPGFAQTFNRNALKAIGEQQHALNIQRKRRLQETADTLKYPLKIRYSSDKEAVLIDFIDHTPYYISTHNLQARSTTGVAYIQSPLGLNLPLKGEGITVGVWDGGLVLATHVEFDDHRVINKISSALSTHATHVSGTIAAKGINPQALGMLPEARISAYYAFDNDLGPMAFEASQGLMISNHSYGLVLGWEFNNGWQWRGNATEQVDSRFGYYSSHSRSLDEIAYNAPYYMIVRSAGNDRSDIGNGTRPPDGPYDCMGPAAVAKNVLTVGAITGFDVYQNPSSAVMSDFSSWGPTDDGRIKPDIVGDGVGVFSTSSTDDQSYSTLQGTSMSAPNVTGSIALLQQYYREQADTFMTAAALKSLVIHSAREAGFTEGPDYSFGWGVVNVVGGYQILHGRNDLDTMFIEAELPNGSFHEYTLFSDGHLPITATIAWTDVPGTPGSQGTTQSMLINDLDIRLIDVDDEEEFSPWILSLENPSAPAIKGDNFRDNVEKIELQTPEPGLYTLRVSHKNSLVNAAQDYGLTFTGSTISGGDQTIYWINGSGTVDGNNWSNSPGGPADNGIDPDNKTWVFDNKTTIEDNDVIQLHQSLEVKNLLWLEDSEAILDLNGHTLTVRHELIVQQPELKIRNGVIILLSEDKNAVTLNFDGADGCNVVINSNHEINLTGATLESLSIVDGEVSVESQQLNLNELVVANDATFTITNSQVSIGESLEVQGDNLISVSTDWLFTNSNVQIEEGILLELNDVQFTGNSQINGNLKAEELTFDGILTLMGNIETDVLNIEEGSTLNISDLKTVVINSEFTAPSSASSPTSIIGLSSVSPATLSFNFRQLICLDFMNLENLNIDFDGIFNVGENSTASNVTGIVSEPCEELIFPDFSLNSSCANSAIQISNSSSGEIETYSWDFGNGFFMEGVNDVANPEIIYNSPGTYTITLTVTKDELEFQYVKQVEIVANNISNISIIELEDGLIASLFLSEYAWYLNGKSIPDETERTLIPHESGNYQVGYINNASACKNRVSEHYNYELITDINGDLFSERVELFPNPFVSHLKIENVKRFDRIRIYDVNGRVVVDENVQTEASSIDLNLSWLTKGQYLVKINRSSDVSMLKIIKK